MDPYGVKVVSKQILMILREMGVNVKLMPAAITTAAITTAVTDPGCADH